jgi:hypothetical protein
MRIKTIQSALSLTGILIASWAFCAAQNASVPFVNQPLVPTSVAPGGAAFTLTVNGTGFVSGSVVKWNGKTLPTTFISQGQLAATVPAALIANPNTATITVFSPAPGGGTSSPTYFPIATPITGRLHFGDAGVGYAAYVGELRTADFDGDGNIDLAATTGNFLSYIVPGAVGIFYNNGNGSFRPAVRLKTQYFPGALVADLNQDGIPDLLVSGGLKSNPFGPTLFSIFLGNGNETFQNPVIYPTSLYFDGEQLGDFNGDGKLDLATGLGEFTAVFFGNGDGTFQRGLSSPGPGGSLAAVGDFNNDGKLDLAYATTNGSDLVWITLGNGDGTFQTPFSVNIGVSSYFSPLLVADFNGDGILDLLTSGFGNGAYGNSVMLGIGDGTFQPPMVFYNENEIIVTGAADLNNDGKLDLLGYTPNLFVEYLLGNGDGTFQPADIILLNKPFSPVIADFNNDGRLDFAHLSDGPEGDSSVGVRINLQRVP